MGKSIYFFGQSVFGQLISLLDRQEVAKAVVKTGSDKFCKGFYTWDHLVTMLFCSLSHCTSLREVVAGCLGLKGKTAHFGLRKLPRRSTLSEANLKRSPAVFEAIYTSLLTQYQTRISDSRIKERFQKDVFIIDSTTISLFQSILKCVGRKPKSGKEKGGIKVHTLLKADQNVPELVWYSESATHDLNFWDKITFKPDALYVFDKGYIDYERYEKLSKDGIHFVSRLKANASFCSIEEIDSDLCPDTGVLKDEWIELPIRNNGKVIRTVLMRRIAYWDDTQDRLLIFITNQKENISAQQVAALYKQRWQIELLFKQLKQNFPLKYFLGDNENAITIQIWCALICNLLLTIIRKQTKRSWSFSNLVSFSRLHLFNYIHLIRFLDEPEKDWQKEVLETPQQPLFSG